MLRFSKLGKVRFTSHRDVARMWERALRKAAIPVAYTEGFSPRPRLSFGLALPTGHESLGEYLDVDLNAQAGPVDVAALPGPARPGPAHRDRVQAAVPIEPGTPSLQQAVVSCTWRHRSDRPVTAEVEDAVAGCSPRSGSWSPEHARVTRSSTTSAPSSCPWPSPARPATMQAKPARNSLPNSEHNPAACAPRELVLALGGGELTEGRACRIHQWLLLDGARQEPIAISDESLCGATPAPHAAARAS